MSTISAAPYHPLDLPGFYAPPTIQLDLSTILPHHAPPFGISSLISHRVTSPPDDVLRVFPTWVEINAHDKVKLQSADKRVSWYCHHTRCGDADIHPGLLADIRKITRTKRKNGDVRKLGDGFCEFAIGARVMVTSNSRSCLQFGLCNSATGTIHSVWLHPTHRAKAANPPTPIVLVQMDKKFWRCDESFLPDVDRVVPIPPERISWKMDDGSQVVRWRCPLQLAYSITSHKVQGLTLPAVATDTTNMTFDSGLGYVTASRVRHLDDFYLLEEMTADTLKLKWCGQAKFISALMEWNRLCREAQPLPAHLAMPPPAPSPAPPPPPVPPPAPSTPSSTPKVPPSSTCHLTQSKKPAPQKSSHTPAPAPIPISMPLVPFPPAPGTPPRVPPRPQWRMRIIDYWGFSSEVYAVELWAAAVGFQVESTIVKGAQSPNACGYIAAHTCATLRRAGLNWQNVTCIGACNPGHVTDGNRFLKKPKGPALCINGDDILKLVKHWSPGNNANYVDGPYPFALFMNTLGEHVRSALHNPPTPCPVHYNIVNTSSVMPGVHWFVVAYCMDDLSLVQRSRPAPPPTPAAPARAPPVAVPPAHDPVIQEISDSEDEMDIDSDEANEAWIHCT